MFNSPSVFQKGNIVTNHSQDESPSHCSNNLRLMQTLHQEQSEARNQTKTLQDICETGRKKQRVKYQLMTIWSEKAGNQIKTAKKQKR